MFDFLKKVPLFGDLPKADLLRLCEDVEEVTLSSGEELFAEGSTGDKAYVVKEGELEILKASSGRDVLLADRVYHLWRRQLRVGQRGGGRHRVRGRPDGQRRRRWRAIGDSPRAAAHRR